MTAYPMKERTRSSTLDLYGLYFDHHFEKSLLTVVKLSDKSIATNRIYERSGVRNPKTGEFVEETLNATVIHEKQLMQMC
mgnify:CR=1 FL=1